MNWRTVSVGLILTAFSIVANGQQYTMKLASATINDIQHEWQKQFKAGVDARSRGRIKVEIYPASQLGAIPRMVEGVALGTIESFITPPGFLVGVEPRFEIFDAGGGFDDAKHAKRVFADETVRRRIFAFGNERGIQPIAIMAHSPNALLSRKPVRSMADLNGLKIRTFSTPMQIEPLKKLGASPVPLPLTEVMPALQNGAIDGLLAASTVYTAFKYYDAAKALTYLPAWDVITTVIVNKNWLASLPADLVRIVMEEAQKAEGIAADWGMADVERSKKIWTDNGGENISFSAAEQKKFLSVLADVNVPLLNAKPRLKTEYETLLAAAKKLRR